MERDTATTIFEALSSGVRLDAFRLLIRKGAEGLVAGDIAAALDVPPSNLSFHLKALTHAGLLSVEQEGRFQRYRANTALMMDLVAYLTAECCVDSLGQCPGAPGGGKLLDRGTTLGTDCGEILTTAYDPCAPALKPSLPCR